MSALCKKREKNLKREHMPRRAKESEVINSLFSSGAFKPFPTRLNQILQAVPGLAILFYISLLPSPNNTDRKSIVWCYISGEI